MFKKHSILLNKTTKSMIKQFRDTFDDRFQIKLLMRGTEDGFTAEKFHRLCDNMGPTLTVIKSDNSEFGQD